MEIKEDTINNIESEHTPESKEISRKNLFRKIRSKLIAMAMAGLITFGTTKEALADQVKFEKSGESGIELKLEPAITEEKLRDFEEKLKREEPEFIEWLDKYEKDLSEELDRVSDKILNLDSEEDSKAEIPLKKIHHYNMDRVISDDHRVVEFFRSHPGVLRNYQKTLQESLRNILLGASLLDDSMSVRHKLLLSARNPKVTLDYHYVFEVRGVIGYTTTEPIEIHVTPRAFLGLDGKISMASYFDFMTHEIFHMLQNSGGNRELLSGLSKSELREILIEGYTQNMTYEIIQFLQSQNKDLKSVLGHHPYDQRIIAATMLDAISKSHGSGDSLARWAGAMINDDQLAQELKEAIEHLDLDPGIADDLINFKIGSDQFFDKFKDKPSLAVGTGLKLTISILARLKNSGLSLPPEFINNIYMEDRVLDEAQRKEIKKLTEQWDFYSKEKKKDLNRQK